MTTWPDGTIPLRCNPLFQCYSRRLLFLFFLRSLRLQWKAVRRIAGAFVIAAWRNAIDLDHVAAMRAMIVLTPLVLLAKRGLDYFVFETCGDVRASLVVGLFVCLCDTCSLG